MIKQFRTFSIEYKSVVTSLYFLVLLHLINSFSLRAIDLHEQYLNQFIEEEETVEFVCFNNKNQNPNFNRPNEHAAKDLKYSQLIFEERITFSIYSEYKFCNFNFKHRTTEINLFVVIPRSPPIVFS